MSLSSGIDLLRSSSSELIHELLLRTILTTKPPHGESARGVFLDPSTDYADLLDLCNLCNLWTNESFSPHKTPFAGHIPADLLHRAVRALLEDQRTREPALDVQRGQPTPRDGTLSGKATRYPALGDLDDTGTVSLDTLRGARVGRFFHFDSRARRWVGGGHDRVEQSANGSIGVALGVRMVSGDPTRVAFRNAGSAKREPRPCCPKRMGAVVQFVLEFLARSHRRYADCPVALKPLAMEYLASKNKSENRTSQEEGLAPACSIQVAAVASPSS